MRQTARFGLPIAIVILLLGVVLARPNLLAAKGGTASSGHKVKKHLSRRGSSKSARNRKKKTESEDTTKDANKTESEDTTKNTKDAKNTRKTESAAFPRIIDLPSSEPLYTVKIMVMAGSADDPAGREGVANLVARSLLEGGFGNPKKPMTAAELAKITRPWGSLAMPSVVVDKQTTTFSMSVPKEVFPDFVKLVLRPMFSQPLFLPQQVAQLRAQSVVTIQSGIRQQQDILGLESLESYLFQNTPLSPLSLGTIQGLAATRRSELLAFYRTFYTARDVAIATNADPESAKLLRNVLRMGAPPPKQLCNCSVTYPRGREVLIVTQPQAAASILNLGFPIETNRNESDFWPLLIANTYLSMPDSPLGKLAQNMRQEFGHAADVRSYIEYPGPTPTPAGQHTSLLPAGTPRSEQYFSISIGPVAHEYTPMLLNAATVALQHFIQEGLTPAQVEQAKAVAVVSQQIEDQDRQLGYQLDDAFYGAGDRDDVAKNLSGITADQVNGALRRNLQASNVRYVLTTNDAYGQILADSIATAGNAPASSAKGKGKNEGDKDKDANIKLAKATGLVTAPPLTPKEQSAAPSPLEIKRENIHVVSADQMFETGAIPGLKQTTAKMSRKTTARKTKASTVETTKEETKTEAKIEPKQETAKQESAKQETTKEPRHKTKKGTKKETKKVTKKTRSKKQRTSRENQKATS